MEEEKNLNSKQEKDEKESLDLNNEIKSLKEKLTKQKEDLEDKDDRIKRLMAEFENFKKRSDKERTGLYNSVMGDVITSLLPVLDNLEKAAKTETKDEQYKNGIEMVVNQFKDVLKANGVTEIEAVGKKFDPSLHEAVSLVQDEKLGEKFRKRYGYTKNDKVVFGIGLYIERKGIVDFVELAKRLPEYKFIWFGYSPLMFATRNVKKAVKTKLDNLTFAGYVKQDVIKGAMNGGDLYLFPTLEETEGIPIIEACACMKDAIIRDIPIFDDWLIDGKNVYKAKNVDEFEKKIKDFFEGKLPSVAKESYEVAKERDIKNVGIKLKQIYESLYKNEKK